MKKNYCYKCAAPLDFEAFFVSLEDSACLSCFKEYHGHTSKLHVYRGVCLHAGCTQWTIGFYGTPGYCEAHYTNPFGDKAPCNRCGKQSVREICGSCESFLASQELRAYRSLSGNPTEIKERLQRCSDYEELGSYERLVDLVCRDDIQRHAEELEDQGIIN